ncbi:hypothetical protein SAY87_027619 [Trapa incisa]|uniref:Uncharacterized protein n=1 Tax=Trapa incisa TaxID=236973 RepID=A0AAN7PQR0_9MYRT|nr:hypothetical protein SAY87_027619 [Trapa incisa]
MTKYLHPLIAGNILRKCFNCNVILCKDSSCSSLIYLLVSFLFPQISLAIGFFLFLGGGMRIFSTSNSSVTSLLITLYPRLPTGSNDNRCQRYWYQVINLIPQGF